jgi:hypothetical protein
MDSRTFDALLNLVKESLTRQGTVIWTSIPAEERLVATFRFLATGRTYEDLKFSTGVSAQALRYSPRNLQSDLRVAEKRIYYGKNIE